MLNYNMVLASCWSVSTLVFVAVQGYGNCSCIGDVSSGTSDVSSSAVPGVCEVTSCYTWSLVIFVIMIAIAMLLIFTRQMLHVSAMLRCIKTRFVISVVIIAQTGTVTPSTVVRPSVCPQSIVVWYCLKCMHKASVSITLTTESRKTSFFK